MADHLTARMLRDLIKDVADDSPVVIGAPDHEYRHARLEVTTALYSDDGVFTEDMSLDPKFEAVYGKRIPILLIH